MKVRIITLIKFIIFVAIFYALLAFNVFNIGERLLPTPTDYIEIDTPEDMQDLERISIEEDNNLQIETGHGVAGNGKMFENLCNRITICEKIYFNGSFIDTEKYNYTRIVDRIVQFINDNGNEDKKMEEVISKIDINKGNGERRGSVQGRDSIVFNLGFVQSKKEFLELSTHEIGHIVDLGYIQGFSFKKDKNFTEFGKVVFAIDDPSLSFYKFSRDKEKIRKAVAKKKDFCSGYGMSDPFEDLAECFNLYTNHNSFFRQVAKSNTVMKKKYNFIAGIFDGKYITSNSQDLTLIKTNSTRRPRDTTKLSN
ncbi:MAG: hypothetical protein WC010_04495 [Candidatus Absconditabacterales bacterium]